MAEMTPPPGSSSRLLFRELCPDEWDRLDELPPAPDGPLPAGVRPDPRDVSVIVGERNGRIVAFWMLVFMPHMEGFWLDEAERTGGNILRTVTAARQLL